MKKHNPSKFDIPCSLFHGSTGMKAVRKREAFTLIEVILVMVVIVVVSAISLPHFASSFKGNKLRTSARTIHRMAKYARSMAIMRDETLTVALNHETMEVFLGGVPAATTNEADGELDQDVLKRLGYVDGEDGSSGSGNIEKEVHRFLPDGLSVREFDKDWTEKDDDHEDLYRVDFYPNGQCEWFKLELQDSKGGGVLLEIDPISGKMTSEFTQ